MSKQNKQNKSKSTFIFNPGNNGGESVSLVTNMELNEDNCIDYNQQFSLNSYCNSVTFNLYSAILTPKNLRELANQLEIQESKLLAKK